MMCETTIEKNKRQTRQSKVINKKLNLIGHKLGFEFRLSLNIARHSFATRLKLDGTPLSFISDALGHSSTKTTEHYMKSIPDENLKRISDSLLNFTNY
ncbi:MAG: tyrosine-type recombinase/integrase [Chitinophagaceae bacterium]